MQSVETVLVDTSVWVDYLRGIGPSTAQAVHALLQSGRACICGVVLTELLAGARNERDRQLIDTMFRGLPYLELPRPSWLSAGALAANLRSNGVTLPLADVLIATVALGQGCQVYTMDAHFQSVPGLTLYQAA